MYPSFALAIGGTVVCFRSCPVPFACPVSGFGFVDCGWFIVFVFRPVFQGTYLVLVLVLVNFPSVRWLVLEEDSSARDSSTRPFVVV